MLLYYLTVLAVISLRCWQPIRGAVTLPGRVIGLRLPSRTMSLASAWNALRPTLASSGRYSTNENHAKGTIRMAVPSSKNRSATSTGPSSASIT